MRGIQSFNCGPLIPLLPSISIILTVLFICICSSNMALKQRKNFRLSVINYIVVRGSYFG